MYVCILHIKPACTAIDVLISLCLGVSGEHILHDGLCFVCYTRPEFCQTELLESLNLPITLHLLVIAVLSNQLFGPHLFIINLPHWLSFLGVPVAIQAVILLFPSIKCQTRFSLFHRRGDNLSFVLGESSSCRKIHILPYLCSQVISRILATDPYNM